MPPKPRWFAHLPQIRRQLEALPESCPLDRQAVERLFGVKPRQANNLMSLFAGYTVGQSFALSRSDLLSRIDEMARPGGVAHKEIQQKIRAVTALNALQQQAQPRRIPAPPPPPPTGAPLPTGVHLLAAGQIRIDFTTPEELLSRILALSQSAVSDFAAFASSLVPMRSGDCTVGKA